MDLSNLTASTILIPAVLVTLGYYALMCWVRPFRPCRGCDGLGRIRTRFRIVPCRRCRATGRRLRFGRALWNAGTRTTHKARKAERGHRGPTTTRAGDATARAERLRQRKPWRRS